MSTTATNHHGLWSSWRWALSSYPQLVPQRVSCQLSPCKTAVSAQVWNQSWSLNVHVQSGDEVSFHGSASVVMSWWYSLASPDVLSLLAWASALHSPPNIFLVEGVIFVPWNAERFITCQSMTPFHFQLATSTAPPRWTVQGKASPSEMLLSRSKIVLMSWPPQSSCPSTCSGLRDKGPGKGAECD